MNRRTLIFAFLSLIGTCGASGIFGQSAEQQATKIRQLYAATNQRIQAGAKDNTQGLHFANWTLGGERDGQQWAAVGTMKLTAEFWFDGDPFNEEDGRKPDARKMIRKIVSIYAGAADLRTRAEYYFDASGSLVFAFTNELTADNKTAERRFYYVKGKLFRIARDGKNTDRNFAGEDAQLAAEAQTKAKHWQNIFAMMFVE